MVTEDDPRRRWLRRDGADLFERIDARPLDACSPLIGVYGCAVEQESLQGPLIIRGISWRILESVCKGWLVAKRRSIIEADNEL